MTEHETNITMKVRIWILINSKHFFKLKNQKTIEDKNIQVKIGVLNFMMTKNCLAVNLLPVRLAGK
jgi:hypothetical protein